MQIHSTKDFSKFQSLRNNRGHKPINETHLTRLEKSILENNLLPYRPILVNEFFTIIDGHHRFEVAKRNDLEIFYFVKPGATYKDSIRLTYGTTDWALKDYIICRSENGESDYVKLNKFLEEHNLTIHNFSKILTGGGRGSKLTTRVKNGTFVFEDSWYQYSDALTRINIMIEMLNNFSNVKKAQLAQGDFWYGCFKFLSYPEVRWDYFKVIFEKYLYKFITKFSDWKMVVTALVTIYNYDLKASSRLVLEDVIKK